MQRIDELIFCLSRLHQIHQAQPQHTVPEWKAILELHTTPRNTKSEMSFLQFGSRSSRFLSRWSAAAWYTSCDIERAPKLRTEPFLDGGLRYSTVRRTHSYRCMKSLSVASTHKSAQRTLNSIAHSSIYPPSFEYGSTHTFYLMRSLHRCLEPSARPVVRSTAKSNTRRARLLLASLHLCRGSWPTKLSSLHSSFQQRHIMSRLYCNLRRRISRRTCPHQCNKRRPSSTSWHPPALESVPRTHAL